MIAHGGNFLVQQFGTSIFIGLFSAIITANNGFSTIFGYFFRYAPMPNFSTGLFRSARCLFMSRKTRSSSSFHRALNKLPFNMLITFLINVNNKLTTIKNFNFLERGLVINSTMFRIIQCINSSWLVSSFFNPYFS